MLLSKIKPNPNNPRSINEDKFEKLVKSIREFPEMLNLRPIVTNEDMIVLGGNMRLKACKEVGLKDVPHLIFTQDMSDKMNKKNETSKTYEEHCSEFIIKDNASFGSWDFVELDDNWSHLPIEDWGIDKPIERQVDEMEDDDEIELPQSVQLEPPKEYILIMAEPNSVEWEEIKEMLKLKMVRRGGYKKGSVFDAVSLERVLYWEDFKKRLKIKC